MRQWPLVPVPAAGHARAWDRLVQTSRTVCLRRHRVLTDTTLSTPPYASGTHVRARRSLHASSRVLWMAWRPSHVQRQGTPTTHTPSAPKRAVRTAKRAVLRVSDTDKVARELHPVPTQAAAAVPPPSVPNTTTATEPAGPHNRAASTARPTRETRTTPRHAPASPHVDLPVSPFKSMTPATTASVLSYFITLQRMHRGARNRPRVLVALSGLVVDTVVELCLRLPELIDTDAPAADAIEWSEELGEHVLLTTALYASVQQVRPVRRLTRACARRLAAASRVHVSEVTDDEAAARVAMDGLARRARLAGLLMSQQRQREEEDAFVRDVLAAHDPDNARSVSGQNTVNTAAPQATSCTADELVEMDPRDAYLFSALLPYLYTALARFCQRAVATTPSAGMERQEKEAFSRVAQVLSRAVQSDLIWTVPSLTREQGTDSDEQTHTQAAATTTMTVVVFGRRRPRRPLGRDDAADDVDDDSQLDRLHEAPGFGSAPAVPLTQFLAATHRFSEAMLAEHHAKHALLHQAPHPISADGQIMPALDTHSEDVEAGTCVPRARAAYGDRGVNFHIDAVLPVLQLLLNHRTFACLFSHEEGEEQTGTVGGSSGSSSALVMSGSASVWSLLHVAVQWTPTLLSYQVASLASLYSRALTEVPPSTSTTPDAGTVQTHMLLHVRRGLLPPVSSQTDELPIPEGEFLTVGDEWLCRHPGVITVTLIEAAHRRLDKYFPSDMTALLTALQSLHTVIHTAETSPLPTDAAAPALPASPSSTPSSRFTRAGARHGAATRAAKSTGPASSATPTRSSCAFDWVRYETALQRLTSAALARLARQAAVQSDIPYWRLLLSSPQAMALAERLPSWLCRTVNVLPSNGQVSEATRVYLRLPAHLVTAVGRSKEMLVTAQSFIITPHELWCLTRTLACFSTAYAPSQIVMGPHRGEGPERERVCAYPLSSLHSGTPYAWYGVLNHALLGSTDMYMGAFDHHGTTLAQMLICQLGLLPQERIVHDFLLPHRTILAVLISHRAESITAAEMHDTLKSYMSTPAMGALSQATEAGAVLLDVSPVQVARSVRRQSGHFSVTDSLAILLTLLSQCRPCDVSGCVRLCFALWHHVQKVHGSTLRALLAVPSPSAAPAALDSPVDRACASFVVSVLMPFYVVCRGVLCSSVENLSTKIASSVAQHTLSAQQTTATTATPTDTPSPHHLRFTTRLKYLHALHDVLLAALERATVRGPPSHPWPPQPSPPLWQTLAVCEQLSLHAPALSVPHVAALPSPWDTLAAIPEGTHAFMTECLTAQLTHRTTEELARTLTSVATRASATRMNARAVGQVSSLPSLPPLADAHLGVVLRFDAVRASARRASLHYFTLLPFVLAQREAHVSVSSLSSSSLSTLLSDPSALLADMAARVGPACATVDAFVFVVQQVSLVDAALLTGAMPAATHWTQHVSEDAQVRLSATLSHHMAHLLVAPLDAWVDALKESGAVPDYAETDGEASALDLSALDLPVHSWPYSVVDVLHLVVLLIEAEACSSRGDDHGQNNGSLLSALHRLQRHSVLRDFLTDHHVGMALARTRERDAVPHLLQRAVSGLSSCHTRVRRDGLALVAPFLTFYMRDYLASGAHRGDGASASVSTTTPFAAAQGLKPGESSTTFLHVLHLLAALDVNTLADIAYRASFAAPTSPAARTYPTRQWTPRALRTRHVAEAETHNRLTAALTLSLCLLRHDARVRPDAHETGDGAEEDSPNGAHAARRAHARLRRLGLRLLARGTTLLSTHWGTWIFHTRTCEERAQLLADLLDLPVTHTNARFVWRSVQCLVRLYERDIRIPFRWQVRPVMMTAVPRDAQAISPGSPWCTTVNQLRGLVDDEAAADDAPWGVGPPRLSPTRPRRATEPALQLVVAFSGRGRRQDYVPLTSLDDADQRRVCQRLAQQGRPLGRVKLTRRAYECVLYHDAFFHTSPLSRRAPDGLLGMPPLGFRVATRHHLTVFFQMRDEDLQRLRQELGPMEFLTLCVGVLERYLYDLPAGTRSEVDMVAELFDSARALGQRDARVSTGDHADHDALTRQRLGERVAQAMSAALSVHVQAASLRWSSVVLARWLGAAADVVCHLQTQHGLDGLLRDDTSRRAGTTNSLDGATAEPTGSRPEEDASVGDTFVHGDAPEPSPRSRARQGRQREEEGMDAHHRRQPASFPADEPPGPSTSLSSPALIIDLASVVRFLRLVESLCPSLAPNLSPPWRTEDTSSPPSPTPAALVLAAVARAVLSPELSLRSAARYKVHGLAYLLSFRQTELSGVVAAYHEAVRSHQCYFPLTRDAAVPPPSRTDRSLSKTQEENTRSHRARHVFMTHRAVLQVDRNVVESAVMAAVFPSFVHATAESDLLPDRPQLERGVRHTTAALQADDLARLLQLLIRRAASPDTAVPLAAARTGDVYVSILCDTATELLPSLSGASMKAVVRALLPLIATHTSHPDSAGATAQAPPEAVLGRRLVRLCAHIPPLVAHDVDRFTLAELAYVVAALHTPSLFHAASSGSAHEARTDDTDMVSPVLPTSSTHVFARSLVSTEAAKAIRRAVEATPTTTSSSSVSTDDPDSAHVEAEEDEEKEEEEVDTSEDTRHVTANSVFDADRTRAEERWRLMVRVFLEDGEGQSFSRTECCALLRLVEETSL